LPVQKIDGVVRKDRQILKNLQILKKPGSHIKQAKAEDSLCRETTTRRQWHHLVHSKEASLASTPFSHSRSMSSSQG
jgi:hypothetical protein